MKSFEEIWNELREDFDFQVITYSEGSPPHRYTKSACEQVYNKLIEEINKDDRKNYFI
jgi:retron-type reverse transcriptase